MRLAPIEKISVKKKRQRTAIAPEALTELETSILQNGLLHPIVVKPGIEPGEYELVAGERRWRAITNIFSRGETFRCDGEVVPANSLPIVLLSDQSEIAAREAELAENIHRVDLTFFEKASAIRELHDLKIARFGEYSKANVAGWRMQDTLKTIAGTPLGASAESVRDMLVLSEHLDDPEIAAATTPKEAMKVLKRKHIEALTSELALRGEELNTGAVLRQGDSFELMQLLQDGSIDCIITDPPYGIGADSFGDQADQSHNYDDSYESFIKMLNWFPEAAYRVARSSAHLYMFCAYENVTIAKLQLADAGWKVWNRPLIWDKGGSYGIAPDVRKGPRYSYECVIFANKGDKPVTAVYPDVIRLPAVHGSKLLHAAQKPVEVYIDLLRRSCSPGDSILDAFCGSGTVFPAAKELDLKATGFEQDAKAFAIAKARMEEIL